MTDPRALLDAYAEETDFERGDLLDDREHESPKAFAALRAVLDLHACEVRDVWPDPGAPKDAPMGERPVCVECSYSRQLVDWPCDTVQAVTTSLGGQL